MNLPGINSFCSSCSRWLQLPTVALEDLPRRHSVTLQPQNTGVVFFSAKVRPDDQDTQQPCEQSDKQADASELLPRNRANRCFRSLSARRTWDVRPSLRAQRRTSGPSAPSSRTSPRVQDCCLPSARASCHERVAFSDRSPPQSKRAQEAASASPEKFSGCGGMRVDFAGAWLCRDRSY